VIQDSLDRALLLPEASLMFPGHEYVIKNLEFAMALEPLNP